MIDADAERAAALAEAVAWCRGRIDFLERHGQRAPRVNTCGHPTREHLAHGQCWPCYYAANKGRYAKHTKAQQARRRAAERNEAVNATSWGAQHLRSRAAIAAAWVLWLLLGGGS